METAIVIEKQEQQNCTVQGVAQQIIELSPELSSQRKHIEAMIKD